MDEVPPQPATFDRPPGLRIAYEVMSCDEEARLIALIEAAGLTRKPYEGDNPRDSTSFGWDYDYLNDTFRRVAPIPEGFRMLCDRAAEAFDCDADELVQCLLNRYEPGAVIAPHTDKAVWNRVIGISLGSAATMNFAPAGEGPDSGVGIELPRRSMYLMSGPSRYDWTHGLGPSPATRWSITLRSFARPDQAELAKSGVALIQAS